MRDDPDPTNLPKAWKPAEVSITDGTEIPVANTRTDGNWLFYVDWNGDRHRVPAYRVMNIRYAETETRHDGEGRDCRTYQILADDQLAERVTTAKEMIADD